VNGNLVILLSILAAILVPLGTYFAVVRRLSGKIGTSEASDLWKESSDIRADYRSQIDREAQRTLALEERVSKLEERNNELRTENADLRRQVGDLQATISSLEKRIEVLHSQLNSKDKELEREKNK
jgi:septal ring factor EnvC (AmiA/AmiB activator)